MMHPAQRQPDFSLLPTGPNMQATAPTGLRGGGGGDIGNGMVGTHSSHMNGLGLLDVSMDDVDDLQDEQDFSPVREARGLNLAIFKGKNKITKDGLPPKKRGPKRDAKPAVSRRQEMNRQAQRTHRERKEYYTKSLEQEVSRMREAYSLMVKEKDHWQKCANDAGQSPKENGFDHSGQENERLREILRINGIPYESHPSSTGTAIQPTGKITPQEPSSFFHPHQMPGGGQQPQHQPQDHEIGAAMIPPGYHGSFNGAQIHDQHPSRRQVTTGRTPTSNGSTSRTFSPGHSAGSPRSIQSSQTASPIGNLDHSTTGSFSNASYTLGQIMSSPVTTDQHHHHTHHHQLHSLGPTPPPASMSASPTSGTPGTTRSGQHTRRGTIDSVITQAPDVRPAPRMNGGFVPRHDSDERIAQRELEYDQLGVDFVLALEENCRDHQQFLNLRANPPAGEEVSCELSGHAMMLTNPPPSHIATSPDIPYHQPPNIPLNNLMQLLETAQRLPLTGGEITPVLALRMVREDERYGILTKGQFGVLTEKLRTTSRCYGFGAVLEEYEVRDALDSVFDVQA